MPVHLVKLAVGIEDIDHLRDVQARRVAASIERSENPPRNWHITRNMPRQADEIAGVGSLYWVIKRAIRVRQRILGFEPVVNAEGKPACAIVLDNDLVPTRLRPCKAFQGWRYLKPEMQPEDASTADGADDMPPEMINELRELGLL